jgi:hypothetical protein
VVGGLLLGVFRGGDGGRDRDRRVRELPKGATGKILHREVQPPQDLLP